MAATSGAEWVEGDEDLFAGSDLTLPSMATYMARIAQNWNYKQSSEDRNKQFKTDLHAVANGTCIEPLEPSESLASSPGQRGQTPSQETGGARFLELEPEVDNAAPTAEGLEEQQQDAAAVNNSISHQDLGIQFSEESNDGTKDQDLEGDEQDASLSDVVADPSTYDDSDYIIPYESDSVAGGGDSEPTRAHNTPDSPAVSIDDSGYGPSLSSIASHIADIDDDGTYDSDLDEELQQVGEAETDAFTSEDVQTASMGTEQAQQPKKCIKTIDDLVSCAKLTHEVYSRFANATSRANRADLTLYATDYEEHDMHLLAQWTTAAVNENSRRRDSARSVDPVVNQINAAKNGGFARMGFPYPANVADCEGKMAAVKMAAVNVSSPNNFSAKHDNYTVKVRPVYIANTGTNSPQAYQMFTFRGRGLQAVHPDYHHLFVEVVHSSDIRAQDPNVIVVDGGNLLHAEFSVFLKIEPVSFHWNQAMHEHNRSRVKNSDGTYTFGPVSPMRMTDGGLRVFFTQKMLNTGNDDTYLASKTGLFQTEVANLHAAALRVQGTRGPRLNPVSHNGNARIMAPGANSLGTATHGNNGGGNMGGPGGNAQYQPQPTVPHTAQKRGAYTALISVVGHKLDIHSGPVGGAGFQVATSSGYDRFQ